MRGLYLVSGVTQVGEGSVPGVRGHTGRLITERLEMAVSFLDTTSCAI